MIFLFAPALVALTVILIIMLKDQFASRRPVPMLDQIQSELANRRRAAKVQRIFEADIVLVNLASRRVFPLVDSPITPAGPQGSRQRNQQHINPTLVKRYFQTVDR